MANIDTAALIAKGLELLGNLFKTKGPEVVAKAVDREMAKPESSVAVNVEVTWDSVNWDDPRSNISRHFTVAEAIALREWNRLATAEDGLNDTVKQNLFNVFQKMDQIREILGKPIFVRSAYRPSAYNIHIGGAARSAHMADEDYAAVDFWTDQNGDGEKNGEDCDLIKDILRPKLAELGLRMELNGQGARWVHVDTKPVPPGGHIEFNP